MPSQKRQKTKKPQKQPVKSCEICGRANRDDRRLGPLITVEKSFITAHYQCVLFCPKTPETGEYGVDGIAGMTARFIRDEGKRVKSLVLEIFIPTKYFVFGFVSVAPAYTNYELNFVYFV